MYEKNFRELAFKMRKDGYSYSFIREKVPVAKSTLTEWLAKVPFRPNDAVIRKIGKARAASAYAKHKKKIESIEKARELAKKDVGTFNQRDVFMLGIALYIGSCPACTCIPIYC